MRKRKPTCNVRPGMRSEDVLALPGRGLQRMTHPPAETGRDRNGPVVRWCYQDVDIILKVRYARDGNGPFCFRVSRVVHHTTTG